MYPMVMEPCFKSYLWGGSKLKAEYGKSTPLETVAESWEVSCHPDGYSLIQNGSFAGERLADVVRAHPRLLGERFKDREFPLIVKLIDSKQWLSLQVHPNRALGLLLDGQKGKNEFWYVLDAEPGAQIALGFRHPLSKEALRRVIGEGALLEHVNLLPAGKGDCFYIPSGLIHAIGQGLVILEVQESSTLTYRIFDYDRRDNNGNPRELHVEKALQALDPAIPAGALGTRRTLPWDDETLIANESFGMEAHRIMGGGAFRSEPEHFSCLCVTKGSLELFWNGAFWGRQEKGASLFLPATLGEFRLKGNGEILLIRPGV